MGYDLRSNSIRLRSLTNLVDRILQNLRKGTGVNLALSIMPLSIEMSLGLKLHKCRSAVVSIVLTYILFHNIGLSHCRFCHCPSSLDSFPQSYPMADSIILDLIKRKKFQEDFSPIRKLWYGRTACFLIFVKSQASI